MPQALPSERSRISTFKRVPKLALTDLSCTLVAVGLKRDNCHVGVESRRGGFGLGQTLQWRSFCIHIPQMDPRYDALSKYYDINESVFAEKKENIFHPC